jgi:hypothetical protein
MQITSKEIEGIKFYLGDNEVANNGTYRGGNKAYVTINALLNPGTKNEQAKIKEGKKVQIFDTQHLISYITLILDMYSAMYKYMKLKGLCKSYISYKVERTYFVEELICEVKCIFGNFSTCKNGFLPQYAHDKENITLLEIVRDENLPYLDFADLLGENYSKPEEAEILIPPYSSIDKIEERSLTEEELLEYTDRSGNPPKGKKRIYIKKGNYDEISEKELQELFGNITNEDVVKFIMKIIEKLSAKDTLSNEEIERYSNWKQSFRKYVRGRFRQIENEIEETSSVHSEER